MARKLTLILKGKKLESPRARYSRGKKIGVRRVEIVNTRQGTQVIDNTKLVRTMRNLDNIINTNFNWNNEEECRKAEEDFREYMKKQGYTRF